MNSGLGDFFQKFWRLKEKRSSEVLHPGRAEGGYLLILLSIVGFLFVTQYLLGQKISQPEKVTLSYFVEPVGREMSVQEAELKLRAGQFQSYKGGNETLDLGYMREGVWVLMNFASPADSTSNRFVLQLRHTYINGSFTPLTLDSSGQAKLGVTQSFTDKLLPRTQGLNDIRHVSFPIHVEPGKEFRALVRLRAHVMSVPFLLLPEREFLSSIVREMVIMSSFFGGLMLLALYNVMVGLARRENEFIFYGCYVLAISLMIVAINGSGHMFIWPDNLWLHYNSANMLTNLCCLSYLAFTLSLFKDAALTGLEKHIWQGIFALCGIGLVLQVVEGGFFASIEANLAVLATLCLSLIRAWRVRPVYGRLANLFLISEGVLFLGATIYCIKMFGWLPATPFTINIVTLAATLEGILLSFVLSEKMRRTMNEKAFALERLAAAQHHLESSVRDRTLALAARYTSHEVLNPVFAVRLKAERIRDEIILSKDKNNREKFPVAENILEKVNEMFRLIDSIIHTIRAIKSLSGDGRGDAIVSVDLSSAIEDALRMLEAKALQVDARIEIDLNENPRVLARRSDVVHILMNLISNSFDALSGQSGQWIRIQCRWAQDSGINSGDMLEISVTDSGTGINKEIKNQLFTAEVSTKDHNQGMGLGLVFCQKLALRNNGAVGLHSERVNTSFYVLLPAAVAKYQPQPQYEQRTAS